MTETVRIGADVPRPFYEELVTLAGQLTVERRQTVPLADLIREALSEKLQRRHEEAGNGKEGGDAH